MGVVNELFIVYISYKYELQELTKILQIAWMIVDPSGALILYKFFPREKVRIATIRQPVATPNAKE